MKIVVDAFGGDNAPNAIIEGTIMAMSQNPEIEIIFTGIKDVIEKELEKYTYDKSKVEIVDAPEIITCEEKPTVAIKKKKESSLVKALQIVADKKADCFVSAGSTGAVLAGATLIVRRIKGVKRPALAPIIPTVKDDTKVLLIDCGANVDCKPQYLQQFAVMGSAYMKYVEHTENPRVGLINNGAEEEKGNDLTKTTYQLLKNSTPVNFVGNCEAREINSGDFDVVVCDGFVGNVALKLMEGVAGMLMSMLKSELKANVKTMVGAKLSMGAFKNLKKKMDYTEYGGAPLLGIDGGIIKAHGSSNAKAFAAAINQAYMFTKGNIVEVIREAIIDMEPVED